MPHTLDFEIPTPAEVYMLYGLLKAHAKDAQLFMVGGCVRDFLYAMFHGDVNSYVPKDVDLTTNLSEQQIINGLTTKYAQRCGVRVHEKQSVDTFGVVFVSIESEKYPTAAFEIAPFRKDSGSKDGRRPDSIEQGSIEDDAMRRDLTINNLYYDFLRKTVLDFNPDGLGVIDVRSKIARFVGDPYQRIEEDVLRVLRFVRFFSRFNDGRIVKFTNQRTLSAINQFKNLHEFKGMSPERIQSEFMLGVKQSLNTSAYLSNLADLDLFPAIFPGMDINMLAALRLGNMKNPKVVLALLLNKNAKVADSLNKAKYPNEIAYPVDFLIQVQRFDPKDAVAVIKARDRRLIKSKTHVFTDEELRSNEAIAAENVQDLIDLSTVMDDSDRIAIINHLRHFEPIVTNGEDLMAQGLIGKEIGDRQRQEMQQSYNVSLSRYLDLPPEFLKQPT